MTDSGGELADQALLEQEKQRALRKCPFLGALALMDPEEANRLIDRSADLDHDAIHTQENLANLTVQEEAVVSAEHADEPLAGKLKSETEKLNVSKPEPSIDTARIDQITEINTDAVITQTHEVAVVPAKEIVENNMQIIETTAAQEELAEVIDTKAPELIAESTQAEPELHLAGSVADQVIAVSEDLPSEVPASNVETQIEQPLETETISEVESATDEVDRVENNTVEHQTLNNDLSEVVDAKLHENFEISEDVELPQLVDQVIDSLEDISVPKELLVNISEVLDSTEFNEDSQELVAQVINILVTFMEPIGYPDIRQQLETYLVNLDQLAISDIKSMLLRLAKAYDAQEDGAWASRVFQSPKTSSMNHVGRALLRIIGANKLEQAA